MKNLCLVGVLVAFSGSVASAQDFDRTKHPWAKWKVGTVAKYSLVSQVGEMKQEGTMEQKLLEVTKSGYKTSTTTTMGGQPSTEEETGTLPKKIGEKKLTVDGKEYDCEVWESQHKEGEKKSKSTIWTLKGKHLPVKLVQSGDDNIELTAVKLSEKVKAAEGEYDCVKMAGTMATQGGRVKLVAYMNMDIPGAIVSMNMQMKSGDMDVVVDIKLTSFSIVK